MKQEAITPDPMALITQGIPVPIFSIARKNGQTGTAFHRIMTKQERRCSFLRSMFLQISGMTLPHRLRCIPSANTAGNLFPAAFFEISQFKDAPGQSIVNPRNVGDQTLQLRVFLWNSCAEIWNLLQLPRSHVHLAVRGTTGDTSPDDTYHASQFGRQSIH